jgi:hypothetical protein
MLIWFACAFPVFTKAVVLIDPFEWHAPVSLHPTTVISHLSISIPRMSLESVCIKGRCVDTRGRCMVYNSDAERNSASQRLMMYGRSHVEGKYAGCQVSCIRVPLVAKHCILVCCLSIFSTLYPCPSLWNAVLTLPVSPAFRLHHQQGS